MSVAMFISTNIAIKCDLICYLTVQRCFVNRSVPENFQWENFSGHTPRNSLCTQDSEFFFKLLKKMDPVLVAQSWVSAKNAAC